MSTPEIVHFYASEGFSDWEQAYALAHIRKPDWQARPGRYDVRTVALTTDPVTSAGGLRVVPDLTVDELDPDASAMLMLIGGGSWEQGDTDAPVLAKARAFLAAGTPVAAICGATYGLAKAGLLDDRAHTSNAAMYLEPTGYAGAAQYRDEPAVTDGDLITASGTAPVDFARHVFARLDLYSPAVLNAWYGLYRTGDASYFFQLMQAGGQ